MNMPEQSRAVGMRNAIPVVFGDPGRQLFGWFHPAGGGSGTTRDCAVVMCNPLGYDAICAHAHYRVLAQQLAAAGFAVLRFDHHGTGDSSGSDMDPHRVPAWIEGIALASRYARQYSGATHVALFGLRMGGTLSLAAAAAHQIADSVIAWSPFASGQLFLREMRALRSMSQAGAATSSGQPDMDLAEEAAGYLLSASTVSELEELSLLTCNTAPAARVLLLARDDIPESDRLARHLRSSGCIVTHMTVPGYSGMMRDTFDSVTPAEAFEKIRGWLEALYAPRFLPLVRPPEASRSLVAGLRGAEANVLETPVRFGPDSSLFGIVSKPVHFHGRRMATGVVFVSVGSNVHVGPNRMHVRQARALAAMGFVALRMDIGGVGESPAGKGHRANHIYGIHSVADVRNAMRFLQERYSVQRIVLVGLCSGAYLAFHSAIADSSIMSIVLINPQTFSWREGDSLQLRTRQSIRAMSFYRRRAFHLGTWLRLLGGRVSAWRIITGVIAAQGRRIGLRWSGWFATDAAGENKSSGLDVRSTFRTLLRRSVDILLIYSADDGGLNEMEAHLGANASALRTHDNFSIKIVDGADHTFTPLWAQRRLFDLVTQHIVRLYG